MLLRDGHLLLSDEVYKGMKMTKYAGGGLEWGEGLADALRREFLEEWDLEIRVLDLVYTNDFFQQSAFNEDDQLLSVYYRVEELDPSYLNEIIQKNEHREERLFWVPLDELLPEMLTFPVDQQATIHLLSSSPQNE
ncbi:MAG: NUDIX domain-containing protein [Bacteroidetes bacterium]|nr:NUDIX domain-containing protein [Bacteroidota bacterium]